MWLTRVSIANPVLAVMIMAALLVLGTLSYRQLRVDQYPELNFPVVVVQVEYPGAAPEVVETQLARPIETAVNTIAGINSLTSRSYGGLAVVVIEFDLSTNPVSAEQAVQEKVQALRTSFHVDVLAPRVSRFDPSDRPMFVLALGASPGADPASTRELNTIAEQVRRRFVNVAGVGAVNVVGGAERAVQIAIDPAKMQAHNVGVEAVLRALRDSNQRTAAGLLRSSQSETTVQAQSSLVDVDRFGELQVARRGDLPVTLRQLGRVTDDQKDQESVALFQGRRVVALEVLKAQGHDTIAVADGAMRVLVELKAELQKRHPGLAIDIVKDAARPIRLALANVRTTLIEGAVLTVLVIWLSLNSWRSTVITALALPVALIGTFSFVYLLGCTINMVTMMALSLCVGLLIDDAIVVRENIVRHLGHRTGAEAHRVAAIHGTAEISLAVLATTLTILAVFIPVAFMGGIIGRFFHQFGITVSAAVLISMLVAFSLDPMLSAKWHGTRHAASSRHQTAARGHRLGSMAAGLASTLTSQYQLALNWSLSHRISVLVFALLTFLAGLAIPACNLIGSEFLPQADFAETGVAFQTVPGSSLEATELKAVQVERAIRQFKEVRALYTTINTGNAQGKNMGTVFIKLCPRSERDISAKEFNILLRQRLRHLAGIRLTHVGPLDGLSNDNKQIRISLQGPDIGQLASIAAEAQRRMATIPGLVDLDSSLSAQAPRISVELERTSASDLGIGVSQVGTTLRTLLNGEIAANWWADNGESVDVRVGIAATGHNTIDDLKRIALTPAGTKATGAMVMLGQIAQIRDAAGPTQINRRDLRREIELSANTAGRSTGEVAREVKAVLDSLEWPSGYRYQARGSVKNMKESFEHAAVALVLGVTFIYMILASQFSSFLQPLAIMSALPLTVSGAFLALLTFGGTLNLFSVIGLIMLMGLVTKNAILLVDFANRARAAGAERDAALLAAAQTRLRPILMTSAATIFGMLPLAFSLSEGAEQRAPMGQSVIGGMLTATLLTLFVVPVAYSCIDDLRRWTLRRNIPRP